MPPPSTIERSHNALEDGFAAREAWAFEAAYHAFKGALFAAAFHVLGEREEAEDCVHDVLVRLWERGRAYRHGRGSLRAFMIVCVPFTQSSIHMKLRVWWPSPQTSIS